jgi:hypothetical protein
LAICLDLVGKISGWSFKRLAKFLVGHLKGWQFVKLVNCKVVSSKEVGIFFNWVYVRFCFSVQLPQPGLPGSVLPPDGRPVQLPGERLRQALQRVPAGILELPQLPSKPNTAPRRDQCYKHYLILAFWATTFVVVRQILEKKFIV